MNGADKRFAGGAIGPVLPAGRCGGSIEPCFDGLHFHPSASQPSATEGAVADGAVVVPWEALRFELGGASGRVIFAHDDAQDLTLFSEAQGYWEALVSAAHGQARVQLDRLRRECEVRSRRRSWLWLGALGGLLALGALAYGAFRYGAVLAVKQLPHSLDNELGEIGWTQMRSQLEVISRPRSEEALRMMVDRIEPALDGGDWDFRVTLVDDGRINAFALPGGRVVVFKGLMVRAQNAEEVAAVMAHEMAHVTERHGLRRMVQSVGIIGLVQIFLGDIGGLIAVAREVLTLGALNGYGRAQEAEADRVAVRALAKAQLDPRAMAEFFARLEEESSKEGAAMPAYLDWLSTHPSHKARINAVKKQLQGRKVQPRSLPIDWKRVQNELSPGRQDGDREGGAVASENHAEQLRR